ncbi:MAG: SbmA/BacA-like family transporter [bacterium]|nr:SbmA/BacA-like family transporter [bacterium]
MIKIFFASRRWLPYAYGFGALLLLSLYLQVQMTVLFNAWYGKFYTLLQKPQTPNGLALFWGDIAYFFELAIPFVMLVTLTNYLTRCYAFIWREALTADYLPWWRLVPVKIENESQRLQEDTFRFARSIESLGLQIAKAFMTLVSFTPILWGLSRGVHIYTLESIPASAIVALLVLGIVGLALALWLRSHKRLGGFSVGTIAVKLLGWCGLMGLILYVLAHGFAFGGIAIPPLARMPGSLVWVAALASGGGLYISWVVGGKLVELEYNNQVVEANFRKELVYGEDNKLTRALIPELAGLFIGVKLNYHRLYRHFLYFDAWSNLFGQVMIVVPFMIMGPSLFLVQGAITLGLVMQVNNAFTQVNDSLSLFMNNWINITELRSIWMRLHEFQANLVRHGPKRTHEEKEAGIALFLKLCREWRAEEKVRRAALSVGTSA